MLGSLFFKIKAQSHHFIKAWPDASLVEMEVFIYNEGGDLYSIHRISLCLKELEIIKNNASIEGFQ